MAEVEEASSPRCDDDDVAVVAEVLEVREVSDEECAPERVGDGKPAQRDVRFSLGLAGVVWMDVFRSCATKSFEPESQ